MSALRPALVLGLDGATLDVVRPLAAAGRLPNLAAWMRGGTAQALPSCVPPTSFPAWSTFLTGRGPGEHGIFDFTQKLPGAYRIRFVNATDRRGETLLGRVCRAGGRVLALGIPATHPAERVNGLLVPGFDAPVSTGSDAAAASDPALYRRIAARCGPWMMPDLDEAARGGAWHERAVEVLLRRIERKTAFALEALRCLREGAQGVGPDLVVLVFAESDTVAHHYWRDYDAASPRHDPAASALRRGALPAVYEHLDAACGELRRAFGEDAPCFVVSDHGFGGASHRVVHLNRRLADCGLLRRSAAGGASRATDLARAARDLALRALPPRLAQAAFRRARAAAARVESTVRFGGFDWAGTAAFSEEANTQPGVWINLRGREPAGCVAPADYERVRGDVIDALRDWKLPGGEPVVARAWRREEIHHGPLLERAPDVVLELGSDAGYGLSLVPTPWRDTHDAIRTLEPPERGGGRGRGMNGTHRPDGLWITPDSAADAPPRTLAEVAPAILRALGLRWDDAADAGAAPAPYSEAEEAQVAARLRALGYLE